MCWEETVDKFLLSACGTFPSTPSTADVFHLFYMCFSLCYDHAPLFLVSVMSPALFCLRFITQMCSPVLCFTWNIFSVPCALLGFLVYFLFPSVLIMDCSVLLWPTLWTLTMGLGPHNNCHTEFMHLLPAFTHILSHYRTCPCFHMKFSINRSIKRRGMLWIMPVSSGAYIPLQCCHLVSVDWNSKWELGSVYNIIIEFLFI